MYGWIHNCFKEATINLCGEEKWNEICVKAGVVFEEDVHKTTYLGDAEHFAVVRSALELLPHLSEQDLYDVYGEYFISYLQDNGYEAYLLTFGDTLFELLNNVNKLHQHLACSMDKMEVPIINCRDCEEKDSFLLYYSSPRGSRLACLLVGMIKSLARNYFSTEITLKELARQGDVSGSPATVWKVREVHKKMSRTPSVSSSCDSSYPHKRGALGSSYSLSADQFCLLSPCNVVFNSDFEILQISDSMTHLPSKKRKGMLGGNVTDHFRISSPGIEAVSGMDWTSFCAATSFACENQHLFCFETIHQFSKSGACFSYVGKLILLKDDMGLDHAAVFLCSPNVESLDEMYDQGVGIKDLKYSDESRMQMLLNQANIKHFKDSNSEAEAKLKGEVQISDKIRRDLESRRRLMMYISHEIRTPLSTVNFGFRLIKAEMDKLNSIVVEGAVAQSCESSTAINSDKSMKPPMNNLDSDDVRSILSELDSIVSDSAHSVEIAISILNDFLSIEKLQANSLEVYKDFEPCSLIGTVIDEFQVEAQYFNINLTFKSEIPFEDEVNYFIFADKPKIGQVLRNFVSNALKFTPKDGSVAVTSLFEPLQNTDTPTFLKSKEGQSFVTCGTLRVNVKDTGAGIAKENHSKVFREMVQFSPNELQGGGGTGLGLYITAAIVKKHDGSVGFESEGLGKGCNFFFTLPVYRSSSDPSVMSMNFAPTSAASQKQPLLDLTILICDDSDLARKMLRKVLLGMGCKYCYEAKNGVEALKITSDRLDSANSDASYNVLDAFDFILMDDQMPEMNGPEATRRIRKLGFSNPIIGVTGNVDTEDVDNFIESGCNAVLNKPLDTTKLLKHLRQLKSFE